MIWCFVLVLVFWRLLWEKRGFNVKNPSFFEESHQGSTRPDGQHLRPDGHALEHTSKLLEHTQAKNTK